MNPTAYPFIAAAQTFLESLLPARLEGSRNDNETSPLSEDSSL